MESLRKRIDGSCSQFKQVPFLTLTYSVLVFLGWTIMAITNYPVKSWMVFLARIPVLGMAVFPLSQKPMIPNEVNLALYIGIVLFLGAYCEKNLGHKKYACVALALFFTVTVIADGYEANSAIPLEMYCVMLAYVGMSASGLVFGKNSAS